MYQKRLRKAEQETCTSSWYEVQTIVARTHGRPQARLKHQVKLRCVDKWPMHKLTFKYNIRTLPIKLTKQILPKYFILSFVWFDSLIVMLM